MTGFHLLLQHGSLGLELLQILGIDIVGTSNNLTAPREAYMLAMYMGRTTGTYRTGPEAGLKLSKVRPARVQALSFDGSYQVI